MPKKTDTEKEIRRSEVKKYQDTMLADMGLSSLDELSSEEKARWKKALLPSVPVRKKLKEMGYSLYENSNKRSLGSVGLSGEVQRKLCRLRDGLCGRSLFLEAEMIDRIIKISSIPGISHPSEEIEIEGVDEAVNYLEKNPGLTLHLDSPLGSKKWTIGGEKPPLPFHYGEVIEISNPSDDAGWDVIIVPEASSESKKTDEGIHYIPSGHSLEPVGYVPMNTSKQLWSEKTSTPKNPDGKLPAVGNDKIILAPNGKVSGSDKVEISSFFEKIWNFDEIVWL